MTFDIDLFTPCTKYEANLDGLDFPINIPFFERGVQVALW